MRWRGVVAGALAAVLGAGTLSPAEADGRMVDEFFYGHRGYAGPDPFAYRYEPRGYYPYYASRYWVPRREMRYRYRYNYALPEYYPAWGYPSRNWDHTRWHSEHHGRHRPWHW